jgi:hypothetical protein
MDSCNIVTAEHALLAELEERFGSDAALGVTFHLDDGRVLPATEFDALEDAADLDAESQFPDGSSATCCTDFAVQIFRGMPGRVQIFGFANTNNPSSRVARELIHPGGHDFAVLDDRFIVDPWIRLVPMVMTKMVFDLNDPEDAALALDIYGPRQAWERMSVAEKFARDGHFN